jgi:hypothetical protein
LGRASIRYGSFWILRRSFDGKLECVRKASWQRLGQTFSKGEKKTPEQLTAKPAAGWPGIWRLPMQRKPFSKVVREGVRAAVLAPVVVALIHPAQRALAQSSSAGVNGVVTDQNGAVVSGANVALTNVDTNVERVAISNGTGDYFFNEVPPARYTLSFSATGFEKEKISAFAVGVAQVVTINAVLKVGSVQQSVTVEAVNTEVEASTAQLGAVIGTQSVNDLPLDGRNFTQLLDLTPGVTPISTGQNSSASNTAGLSTSAEVTYSFPSVNGAYNRSNLYLTDGMNNNNS